MNIAEIKAYQEKINAQLQEAKAVLNCLAGPEVTCASETRSEHTLRL